MIDKDYIAELKALDDNKEAKAKLAEYAEQFGIKVKKNKSFDNIVNDIEEALQKLASEPMPETDGLSIKDLIDAADAAEGLKYDDEEVNPEAALLIDSPIKSDIKIEVVETDKIPENTSVLIEDTPFVEEKFEQAVAEIIESEKPSVFTLPENFSPNLQLIGKNPGFCTVPWWIYQWIAETPDWKSQPTSFEHASAHQTLFSLIYYINRDGSVLIRETRNSSFVTLK
ncbi:inhibitor of prohead protease [Enterobacteria phage T6]|uniref:Inhibitor of prohead protease n=2 Tax=Tequatrovirus TaxID=10663 RepID=A0A346FJQ9_BPT6|nr:minor head protein inhibitor of protease [Yersinia phage PST]YP_010067327.1 minor head protein inhibitor of protease [Enterobacteria phage T6]AGR46127.1 inhibitor of prohead protease [Yersinia phage PST]AXN58214.1 inhibitor of prohead protease [Enterobacteria phage T6]BBF63598.1 inhibitor of prohead protease [Enterobacteria phage T6]